MQVIVATLSIDSVKEVLQNTVGMKILKVSKFDEVFNID